MNSVYKEYIHLAYRRTILEAIRRFLLEHIHAEVPANKHLVCEEVLVVDRDIPQDAFIDLLEEVQKQESDLRVKMTQYEFRRKIDGNGKQEEGSKELSGSKEGSSTSSSKSSTSSD